MIGRLLLALWACGPSNDVAGPPPHALDDSWLARLTADPTTFTRVVDADRDAWIALHGNQLDAASASAGPAGWAAARRLALAEEDLARLSALAWDETLRAWETRSKLPEGSALPYFAALAARERGDADAEARWIERARGALDATVRAAAERLAATPPGEPMAESNNPLIERYNAHIAARKGGDVAALREAAAEPLWREPLGAGERLLYDPMIHGTLALALAPQREPPSGIDGLLFSPCLTDGHLSAQQQSPIYGEKCTALGLAALSIDAPASPTDDPEIARAFVHQLDASLDPWLRTRLALATPEGADVLAGLDLVRRLRADWLVALARQQLEAGHPHQAMELLRLALDPESGRALSPVNGPSLYALTAEANLRTGHVREALDALEVLTGAWPEVIGVDEVLGDLSILKSLDRMGDSKEN